MSTIFFTDDSYVQWLLENHPNALPEHVRPVEKPPQHSTPLRHREPARSDLTPTNLEKSSESTATATEIHSPRSAITEFLTCPGYSPSSSKQKTTVPVPPSGARVLLSAQSLAMIEEKQRKKKEEEAKERRKQERELKKIQREKEKKKKAEERDKKTAERQKKAAEKEELKRQKAKEREQRLKQKTKNSKGAASKASGETSTNGIQSGEISSNECAVCFGAYDEDLVDGKPTRDWIQCTYADCSKWMHEECLEKDSDNCMICPLCHTLFKKTI